MDLDPLEINGCSSDCLAHLGHITSAVLTVCCGKVHRSRRNVANSEFRVKSAPNPPLAKITGPTSLKQAPPFSRTQMCDRALNSMSSSMKKPGNQLLSSTSARGNSRIGCRLVRYVMISDGDHSRKIKKAARWARSKSFWPNGRFKPTEKKQHGAQQHVLLVEVCLETHPCPARAHVQCRPEDFA